MPVQSASAVISQPRDGSRTSVSPPHGGAWACAAAGTSEEEGAGGGGERADEGRSHVPPRIGARPRDPLRERRCLGRTLQRPADRADERSTRRPAARAGPVRRPLLAPLRLRVVPGLEPPGALAPRAGDLCGVPPRFEMTLPVARQGGQGTGGCARRRSRRRERVAFRAMRVFVAGATGAIGRPLVARLLAAGHEVDRA